MIHLADVYVDEDEVVGEDLGVGRLVEVVIEDQALPAPVSTEGQDDVFMLLAGLGDGDGYVGFGVGGGGVEVFGDGLGGLALLAAGQRKNCG